MTNQPKNQDNEHDLQEEKPQTKNKTLVAIHDNIVFQFEQEWVKVHSGSQNSQAFKEQTGWGFEFFDYNASTNEPRWGYIIAVGPDVLDKNLVPGRKILIDALQWTTHAIYEGQKYWRTDEPSIMAYDADVIPE